MAFCPISKRTWDVPSRPAAAPQVAVGKTSGEKYDAGGIEGMEGIATFKGAKE